MKRLFLLSVLVAFLLQTFSKVFVFAGFELNRDYIAKNLCIQKEIVDNSCGGCCQLNKRLSEDEERQEKEGKQSRQTIEITQINIEASAVIFPACELPAEDHPVLIPGKPVRISHSVFHPPSSC